MSACWYCRGGSSHVVIAGAKADVYHAGLMCPRCGRSLPCTGRAISRCDACLSHGSPATVRLTMIHHSLLHTCETYLGLVLQRTSVKARHCNVVSTITLEEVSSLVHWMHQCAQSHGLHGTRTNQLEMSSSLGMYEEPFD
jgi:hypothetical protein